MAFKKRSRRRTRTSSVAAPRRRRRRSAVGSTTNIIGRRRRTTHRRSTRRVSAVGRRRRHKPGMLGATGLQSRAMQIAKMAVGVGIGAMGVHMILRPLEAKLSAEFPMATKFMGAAEIVIGGGIALWSKSNFVKSIGIGVLAGGVHVVMKQLPIGMHSPAEKAVGDYQEFRIPMDDDMRRQVSGLLYGNQRSVTTPTVGASIIRNGGLNTATPWVSGTDLMNRTPVVAMGDFDDDYQSVLMAKGITVPGVLI